MGFPCQEGVHQFGVEDVAPNEPVAVLAVGPVLLHDVGQAFEIARVGEGVQVRRDDVGIPPQYPAHEVRADEAGTAGYQDVRGFHLGPAPAWENHTKRTEALRRGVVAGCRSRVDGLT